MSALSLRIPTSIHEKIKGIAKKDHVSINQFINSALAEKLAVFMSEEYLLARAKRGYARKYLSVLSKVKKVHPADHDRL